MKDKNKRLFIIVGVLLLVVGVSLAYFVSAILINGTGSSIKASTANINGATVTAKGKLEFNDLDIYPVHQTISGIEVVATGDGEFVPYNLVWKGTNSLNTPLKFIVYKSSTEVNTSVTCNKTTKIENGAQLLAEECNISNKESLGSPIYNGEISKNQEKVVLSNAEFITASKEGNKVYYYVILEYPNLNEEQNSDIGGTFNGNVTIEENNSSADITIASIYKKDIDGYKEVSNIPTEGYILNEEKSTCNNGAKAIWNSNTNSIEINSLSVSGTECNLYYDEYVPTGSDIILNKLGDTIKRDDPDFSQIATTDEGVYAIKDGMYGGTSYYWRGAATTNHLIFANKCWRIVRINGDGSLRLIYNGSIQSGDTCKGNEENPDSIAVASLKYNSSRDRSEYVGWTYSLGLQRTTSGTASNAKIQTDTWYNNNIGNNNIYTSKMTKGKFCNDRNIASGYNWQSKPSNTFYYATYDRSGAKETNLIKPSLNCNSEDIYILNSGAITMDEVIMAGSGKYNTINNAYYLNIGQSYWTMTPSYWYYISDSKCYAYLYRLHITGQLTIGGASDDYGLRPVINLRSDITFSGGNGTLDSPYVVAD